MLHSISWRQYFVFLLIATTAYRLYIWIVFYKARLAALRGLGNLRGFSFHKEDSTDEIISTTQHVMVKLRPFFQAGPGKDEIILTLQNKLKKYSAWNVPGFRDTINEFIVHEVQSKCSSHLSVEDQRVLW